MRNTVGSTEDEQVGRKVKSVGWLGALRTSQKKQDAGLGLFRGKKRMQLSQTFKKMKKKAKNLNQRESGTFTTPTLAPWY